jgi:hypothetical protein
MLSGKAADHGLTVAPINMMACSPRISVWRS